MLFNLNKDKYSNKGAFAFIYVYLFATLFAAILTPLFYWLTQYLFSIFPENETLAYLLNKGVDKYFDRLRWLGVIVGLPYIFKYCQLNSFKSIGLNITKQAKQNFLKYFLLGLGVMIFIYSLQFIFTDIEIKEVSLLALPKIFISAILGALILGFLEEIIFRGLIFRCFYTAWGALPSILFTSFFFAYKHFKVPDCVWTNLDLHTAKFYTGFSVAYYDAIGIFMDFSPLAFASLFILSAFLCTLYLKTKNLYAPIAFHIALVISLKLHRDFFIVNEDDLRNFFGNSGAINSYISIIILSFLLIFSLFYIKKRKDFS